MKRLMLICAVLVLVQTGLAVLTHVQKKSEVAPSAKGPLLKLAAVAVDELWLEDGEGRKVLLKKDKAQWQLPDLASFPADSVRVQLLVERLAGLQRGWPEATTAEAATRFKVAADRFERKLTLRGNGADLGVLYFGSSPGLRKIYLRADGSQEIETLAMDQHDLEVQSDSWIDTRALALKPEQVVRVELPGLTLERVEQGLLPVDMTVDEEIVKDRRDALLKRLAGLTIYSVLGTLDKPEYGLDAPVLRYAVVLENGERIEYLFGRPPAVEGKGKEPQGQLPEASMPVLKVSGRDQLFRVEGWQVEELVRADRAALVRPKVPPQAEAGQAEAPAVPAGAPQ